VIPNQEVLLKDFALFKLLYKTKTVTSNTNIMAARRLKDLLI